MGVQVLGAMACGSGMSRSGKHCLTAFVEGRLPRFRASGIVALQQAALQVHHLLA